MTDENNVPIDDGDRTAGGGVIDPRIDGTEKAKKEGAEGDVQQTGINEVVNGRFGSDVD